MKISGASLKMPVATAALMIVAASMPLFAEASPYGSGSYGAGVYQGDSIAIGPLTLPNTGATWVALGAAGSLSVLGGVAVWRRARRHSTSAN